MSHLSNGNISTNTMDKLTEILEKGRKKIAGSKSNIQQKLLT
jgi:hypothetical protein